MSERETTAPNATSSAYWVDLNAFCDTAGALAGQSSPDEFEALNDYVEGSLQTVVWQAKGSTKPIAGAQFDKTMAQNERFLSVQANTQVRVMCGRCLEKMDYALSVDAYLQVFQSETEADDAAMAVDADTLPDPIVSGRQFDVLAQVQEELLLSMPTNPAHDEGDARCVAPVAQASRALNAFSALAGLKITASAK